MRSRFAKTALAGASLCVAVGLAQSPAHACGGFFCSQTQPVNQAAERIIFANNGDGTVTAVIQIMYEGPAENFSWLLPISSVPAEGDLTLASNIAFDRLQAATNPQYNLRTRVEGRCGSSNRNFANAESRGSDDTGGEVLGPTSDGVSVAASGILGAFEWVALSLDPQLPEPADAAVRWLTENGYDVPPSSEALLGPYLEEAGMFLLALKLTKGSDVGSIRPIVLTYDAELPMIPIKLTAVAANDDMGVMTWVSAPSRAVPFNYLGLELNEARINWFNPGSNYDAVVTAAANDAGGQGFVTEFAGPSARLDGIIWQDFEEAEWQRFASGVYASFGAIFDASLNYQGSDGYWDAVEASVTLPASVPFEDFKRCPGCYSSRVELSPSEYIAALDAQVIEPLRRVQALIDRQPYLTRLYSTLSAGDMTVDPVFTINADLPEVENVHVAERIIECNGDIEEFEASWRIELPQGDVLRGTASDVGTWPDAVASQPANLRVLELGASGPGRVVNDFGAEIDGALADYNRTVPRPKGSGCNLGVSSPAPARYFWGLALLGWLAALRSGSERRSSKSATLGQERRAALTSRR